MVSMTNCLEAAQAYLAQGYSVIPLRPGEKRPLVKWESYQEAHATPEQLLVWWDQWPDANLGIVTGSISNLTVVDVDGAEGQESSQRIQDVPRTKVVKTPKGYHLYFEYNPEFHTGAAFLPGIDARNDGGYVVAPPSVVGDKTYVVSNDLAVATLEVTPEEFQARHRNGTKPEADSLERHPNWVSQALADGAPLHARNDTAIRLAGYFRAKGLPQDVTREVMGTFAERCQPPMDLRELETVIESASRYPASEGGLPPMEPPAILEVDENTVVSVYRLATGQELSLTARDIQRQRTGVHARVDILVASQNVAYDFLNCGRLADRVRLANAATKQLSPLLAQIVGQALVQAYVNAFCDTLWERWLELGLDLDVAGDPLSETEYCVRPWVVKGGGTFAFGPPGAGKSTWCQLIAVSVDAGVSDLWPVEKQPVLYINLERSPGSIARRIGHVNTILGLDPQRSLAVLNRRGSSLLGVADQAQKIVRQRGIGLVILDSITRAGLGKLTEDQPANLAADTLSGICPTWLAIGHTGRGTTQHMYGSQMYDAAGDVMVRLLTERREDGLGVALEVMKANDMPKIPIQVFSFNFDSFGLSGVEKSSLSRWPALAASREQDMAEAVIEYLAEIHPSSADQIATAVGFNRTNVSTFLGKDSRVILVHKDGRTPFYGLKSPYAP